ncbi:polysaccharide lyase [Chromohalobacter israelensis]|uniref:polysaccharide lyase n=1 Tax=Chromohalobacter israelensis TaxID=141390 RepID=UPI003AF476D1
MRHSSSSSRLAMLLLAGTTSALTLAMPTTQANDDDPMAVPLPIPRAAPCSQRYDLAADPEPPVIDDGKAAIRQAFETDDDWGTAQNVEVLAAGDTGLGEAGLRIAYPEGTSAPSDQDTGGAGFYATIPELEKAERACLRYKVRFPQGFEFVKGGKLPGLYGGDAPSGGDEVTGDGYSMRFMWRRHGQGELYEYIVNKGADNDYGKSAGRGLWHFPTGQWVTVEQEIVLNDPAHANGIARVWIDGKPILEQHGIVYRKQASVYADGLMFSTFFGGHGEDWRTPKDQHADFADFRFYTSQG